MTLYERSDSGGLLIRPLLNRLRGGALGPTVIRAALGSAGLRVAGLLFGFLVALQLARGLGPAAYGVYGLAMSVVAVLAVVADLGAARLVLREVAAARVADDWGRVRGLLRWARRTALAASALAAAVLLGWAWWEANSGSALGPALAAAALLVPLTVLANIQGGALRGLGRLVGGQLPDGLLRPAAFSLLLFAGALFLPALGAAEAVALAAASVFLSLGLGALLLRRALPAQAHGAPPRGEPRAWLRASSAMVFAELARALQTHAVLLILGALAASAVVGTYRAASSLLVVFAVADTMLNLVGAPVIARLHAEGDRARLQRLLFALALCSALGTLAVVAPFLLWREALVTLLLGPAYAASTGPLLILGLAFALGAALGPSAMLLNMTGHERRVASAAAGSLLFIAVAAAPLISALGAEGAALTYALSLVGTKLANRRHCLAHAGLDPSVLSALRGGRGSAP